MKAQVLYGINDMRYEDIEEPQLKDGWVIVKVMAAGICGSDIPRIYKTGAHVHPIVIVMNSRVKLLRHIMEILTGTERE